LILFSTDYPHWQFEGEQALPDGLSGDLVRKIMIDNPFATYGRLNEAAPGMIPKSGVPVFGQDHAQTR
jgi:hypothetical protein